MNKTLFCVTLILACTAAAALADEELNPRFMPHDANNDITHMRLQALMNRDKHKDGGEQRQYDPLRPQTLGSVFGDDCNMNIGNTTTQGLLAKPQPIIITGPVINKCR